MTTETMELLKRAGDAIRADVARVVEQCIGDVEDEAVSTVRDTLSGVLRGHLDLLFPGTAEVKVLSTARDEQITFGSVLQVYFDTRVTATPSEIVPGPQSPPPGQPQVG